MWYIIWNMTMKHLHGIKNMVLLRSQLFFPSVVSSLGWFAIVWDVDVRDIDWKIARSKQLGKSED